MAIVILSVDSSSTATRRSSGAANRRALQALLAGESTERIEVSVLDDAHDKGEETLTLLSAS